MRTIYFTLLLKFIILNCIKECQNFRRVRPKIRVGFHCKVGLLMQLTCVYRHHLLQSDKELVNSVELNHTYTFDDESESPTFMGIICKAPYPVKWEHFQERWVEQVTDDWLQVLRFQLTTHQRLVTDIKNSSTFKYSTMHIISNHLRGDSTYNVGEYTCSRLTKSKIISHLSPTPDLMVAKLRVFRKKSAYDPDFPLSGKNVTIRLGDKRAEDGTVVLPCHVSNPETSVALFRKTVKVTSFTRRGRGNWGWSRKPLPINQTQETVWELVQENKYLEFKPSLGFIYKRRDLIMPHADPTEFQLSPGLYKCISLPSKNDIDLSEVGNQDEDDPNNDDYDRVFLNVELGRTIQVHHESFTEPPASFNVYYFNELKQFEISCCSKSANPPILQIVGCFSKDMCERISSHLRNYFEDNMSGVNRLTKINGNCRTTLRFVSAPVWTPPLLARCFGDGIDRMETVILPFGRDNVHDNETSVKPYLNWDDVDPYEMIRLKPILKNPTYLNENKTVLVLYEHQNFTFECEASKAFFAKGDRATADYNNGNYTLFPDHGTVEEKFLALFMKPTFTRFTLNVTKNVSSVTCHIPFADSEKWAEKKLLIHVQKGETVRFINGEEEEVIWGLNETDKKLICEFTGIPFPDSVDWIKDNRTISTKIVNDSDAENNFSLYSYASFEYERRSVLHVRISTYETHGEYICVVKNALGERRKTFIVYVRPSEEMWTIVCVLIGILTFIVIITLMGAATWRQRKELRNLKSPHEGGGGNGFMR